MGAFVLAAANVGSDDVSGHALLPEFRKSSLGMVYTHAAVTKLLQATPEAIAKVGAEQCGIVVGTSQGELGSTKEFLENIALKGVARPIIFQNSLHNSTLGFLTLQFGITGQALTVSNGYLSGEDALSTALLMFDQGLCHLCLVVGFDLLVDSLEPARDLFYPYGLKRANGAGALMLADETGLRRMNSSVPLAFLNNITVNYKKRTLTPAEVSENFNDGHYEADGIAKLVTQLRASSACSPLVQLKPDGMETTITFDRL